MGPASRTPNGLSQRLLKQGPSSPVRLMSTARLGLRDFSRPRPGITLLLSRPLPARTAWTYLRGHQGPHADLVCCCGYLKRADESSDESAFATPWKLYPRQCMNLSDMADDGARDLLLPGQGIQAVSAQVTRPATSARPPHRYGRSPAPSSAESILLAVSARGGVCLPPPPTAPQQTNPHRAFINSVLAVWLPQ